MLNGVPADRWVIWREGPPRWGRRCRGWRQVLMGCGDVGGAGPGYHFAEKACLPGVWWPPRALICLSRCLTGLLDRSYVASDGQSVPW